ncbi:MAG: hypothetical protein ACKPKO_57835 [Candidatus Fonsibacter sp.]
MDLKEFFMTGTMEELSTSVGGLFDDPLTKKLVSDVTDFLIFNQRIMSHTMPDDVYAVIIGSGMGLVHSGEVSDGSYYHIAESRYLDTYRDRYGLKTYLRYRDDIFVIGTNTLDMFRFWIHVERVSKPYGVKMEQVSTSGVDMLDIHVFKGPGWSVSGFLDYRPLIKTTSLGIPLSCDSAHHHAIHSSWTHAEIKRLRCRSSSLDDFNRAKKQLHRRIEKVWIPCSHFRPPQRVHPSTGKGDAQTDFQRCKCGWAQSHDFLVWVSIPLCLGLFETAEVHQSFLATQVVSASMSDCLQCID